MLENGLPDIPLTEKCYRRFWWRKGDVYRLMMSLQNVIDGSTWPKEDKRRVNELVGFIHHVTGASLQHALQPSMSRFTIRSCGFSLHESSRARKVSARSHVQLVMWCSFNRLQFRACSVMQAPRLIFCQAH